MRELRLPGGFQDSRGTSTCTWVIGDSRLPGWQGRFDVAATVRGIAVHAAAFDGLEPDDVSEAAGVLDLNTAGELRGVVTGQLPVQLMSDDTGTLRDNRDQYLAVRGKLDYRAVPVTEDVPEFYVCDEFEARRPGTEYRG